MLRILDLPATLREKVSTSKLLIPHDALSEIARLTDTKKQGELVEALEQANVNHVMLRRFEAV